MTPVGETLRRERLKRNLDFEQISRELKISARFLEAIENDQYDKLPGGVFAKSFVRQYARLLGLDEEDLAGQLQGVIAPEPDISQLAQTRPISVAPIHVPKVDEWKTVGDSGFRWSGSLSAAAMVVVVMLVCSAVYAWLQRPKSTDPKLTVAAQSAAPAQTVPAQTVPASTPVTPPLIAPPAIPGGPAPAPVQMAAQRPAEPRSLETKAAEPGPAVPNPEATVHIQIVAEEAVWVLARADGKYTFSATLNPGESRQVDGVKDVVLRLGNAGGVAILLNGKPLGPVGPRGQARTLQLTSGGFQIVPAKPLSAPLDPIERL